MILNVLLRLARNETSLRGDEAKFCDTKEHTYSMWLR